LGLQSFDWLDSPRAGRQLELALRVVAEPRVLPQVLFVLAAPLGVDTAPTGELPFRLTRHAAADPHREEQGVEPRDVDRGLVAVARRHVQPPLVEEPVQLVGDLRSLDGEGRQFHRARGRLSAEVAAE
jgi:hypothetical protein